MRRCAAASKGRALYAASANPAPKNPRCPPTERPRSERAVLEAQTYTSTEYPTHVQAAAKPNAGAVRPTSRSQALFLSGVRGRFLLASTKESVPGEEAITRNKYTKPYRQLRFARIVRGLLGAPPQIAI